MPEGVLRRYLIPHQLLQLLDVRETSLFLAGPDTGVVYPDFEDAAGAGFQGKFVDHAVEGGEEFLGHPGGSQHPVTAGAVM